jgi:hypothetical protein
MLALPIHQVRCSGVFFSTRHAFCVPGSDVVWIATAGLKIPAGSVVAFFHHVVLSDWIDDLVRNLRDVRRPRYLVARFLQ